MAIARKILTETHKRQVVLATGVASETDQVLIDVSAFTNASTNPRCSIAGIKWALVTSSATANNSILLEWDGTTDQTIMRLTGNGSIDLSLNAYPTISPPTALAGFTGDILLTTGSAVTAYTIIIDIHKTSGISTDYYDS